MTKRVMVFIMCLCLVALTQAEVLIYDSFDDAAGVLNGTTPDIGADAWVADGTYLNLDGSGLLSGTSDGTTYAGYNALLPFTPESGKVYVLSAKVDVLSGDYWLGLGFVSAATAGQINSGFVWIPAGPSIIYMDNGGAGSVKSFVWGDYAPEGDKTSAELGVDISGQVLLECVIDTTQSETSWSISTYVNGVQAMVSQWGENPTIAGVGLGILAADSGNAMNVTIDDFKLVSYDSGQAVRPTPFDGDTAVAPSVDQLSWVNPEPNSPAGPITCDVYWLDSNDPNVILSAIAEDTTNNFVAVTLTPDTQYTWRVDCTDPYADPNTSGPVTTIGDVWTFTTVGDNPPVVDADAAGAASSDGIVRVWLDPVDPNNTTIVLDGTVTDDGQSTLTTTWTLTAQDPAGVTVVIDDPSAVDTFVTVNGTGYYAFQLEAQDALWTVSDSVQVIVHATACEAAYNDPDDISAGYPTGQIGDIDGDCDVDLTDFSIMAGHWMECLSEKLGCTP